MKKEQAEGVAEVADFSGEKDGSEKVEVKYSFEYDVIETKEELAEKFSPEALRDLANARLKSTANSGARQKAIAPYAQDPNSEAAIRARMVKDVLKVKKNFTQEQAEAYVDSLLAA